MQKSLLQLTLLLAMSLGLVTAAVAQDTQGNNNPNANSQQQSTQPNQSNSMISTADRSFVTEAAQQNLLQSKLASLAESKTQNDQVKDLAGRFRDEANSTKGGLQDIASRNNMTLPTSLDTRHQQMYDRMSNLSGAEFDREFTNREIHLQDRAVNLYQNESQNGQDKDIRDFATSKMSTIKQDQQQAMNAQQSMGGAASNTQASNSQTSNTQISKTQTQQQNRAKPGAMQGSQNQQLPRTAGELPLLALLGCLSLAAGLGGFVRTSLNRY